MVGAPLIAIPEWAQAVIGITVQLLVVMTLSDWAGKRIAKWLNARKRGGSQCAD